MKRALLAVSLTSLLLAGCAKSVNGSWLDPTAAVVCRPNKTCIAVKEADIAVRLRALILDSQTAANFKGPQGAFNRLIAQREILTGLIAERIQLEEAESRGISAPDEAVEERIRQVKAQFGTETEYERALKSQGIVEADVRKILRQQVLLEQLATQILPKGGPTDDEALAFYNENKARYDSRLRVAHVLVCGAFDPSNRQTPCAHAPADETTARDITNKARAGEDFAKLAAQFSKDPTNAQTSGELPEFTRGQMVPEFETASFALPSAGSISDPVRTAFGWHVIKLIEKGKSFDSVKEEIVADLSRQRNQLAFNDWVADAIRAAKVRVNPKFGKYDRSSLQVVPSDDNPRPPRPR